MNGIDELERMLESRSTDYGRMRQILAFLRLCIAKEIADSKRRAGIPKTPLVMIIENLVAGDKAQAIDYAKHLINICEDKYKHTGDIFDRYDIMTARNILHTLKGEPKEGGVAVCDSLAPE